MKYLRWLLWPFSLIYGLVVVMRNWCYDVGWFKSVKFSVPVIAVGNLAAGGAGKSPMTEYLVRLLKDDFKIATLSRGYGRKTKGFVFATTQTTANETGDEPAQFKDKFPDITVAVCEDRVKGIGQLEADHNLIILDDAYQHRAVTPGLSILLFDYNKLAEPNLLLPAGNLREPLSGKMRADIIVVSKCPAELREQQQLEIAGQLRPYPYQQLFFSTIHYLPLQQLDGSLADNVVGGDTTVFLLTGIAGTDLITKHLEGYTRNIVHHKYPDHHQFSLKNISKLATDFVASPALNKVVVTTEKDAERLKDPALLQLMAGIEVLVLPINIGFLGEGTQHFNKLIIDYVRKYTTHSSIH